MAERKATVERNTLETQITASVNLDGTGATVLANSSDGINSPAGLVADHNRKFCVSHLCKLFRMTTVHRRIP